MNEWEKLKLAWISARTAAAAAQEELDQAFEIFLNIGTPAPFAQMQLIVDDLRYLEAEARGHMDIYISENG